MYFSPVSKSVPFDRKLHYTGSFVLTDVTAKQRQTAVLYSPMLVELILLSAFVYSSLEEDELVEVSSPRAVRNGR